MSTFREFQAGFEAGRQQKKARAEEASRAAASAMAAQGDWEGASSSLLASGLMDEAATFANFGDRARVRKREETYGDAYRTGGYAGVKAAAGAEGDVGMAASMDQQLRQAEEWARTATLQEREDAGLRMQFFANTAYGLRQIEDPAQRQAALMEIVKQSGGAFGVTAEQAAGFDLSDQSLQMAYESAMSVADRITLKQGAEDRKVEGERWEKSFGLQREGLDLQKRELAAKLAAAKNPAPDIKDEASMRGQYLPQAKEFAASSMAFQRLLAADTTPAGDIAAVYGLMKMIDPNAAVMEGDVANASNTTGVPGQLLALYNGVVNGQKLTPQQRMDFRSQGAKLYAAAEANYGQTLNLWRGMAQAYGFDPERTIPDFRVMDFGDIDALVSGGGGNTDRGNLRAMLSEGAPSVPRGRGAVQPPPANAAANSGLRRQSGVGAL